MRQTLLCSLTLYHVVTHLFVLQVRLPRHDAPALGELQAEERRGLTGQAVCLQASQYHHRRPLCFRHQDATPSSPQRFPVRFGNPFALAHESYLTARSRDFMQRRYRVSGVPLSEVLPVSSGLDQGERIWLLPPGGGRDDRRHGNRQGDE